MGNSKEENRNEATVRGINASVKSNKKTAQYNYKKLDYFSSQDL